jgi:hypothetical protein
MRPSMFAGLAAALFIFIVSSALLLTRPPEHSVSKMSVGHPVATIGDIFSRL